MKRTITATAAASIPDDDERLDRLPGATLLEMAAHLAVLEEELRPASDANAVTIEAWLKVVEQRRRVGETLSKVALDRLDITITTTQRDAIAGVWRERDSALFALLRDSLPPEHHRTLDSIERTDLPLLSRRALLRIQGDDTTE